MSQCHDNYQDSKTSPSSGGAADNAARQAGQADEEWLRLGECHDSYDESPPLAAPQPIPEKANA